MKRTAGQGTHFALKMLVMGLMTVLAAGLMIGVGALSTDTLYADGRILIPTVQKAPPIRHTVIPVQGGDTVGWWQWIERTAAAPLTAKGAVDCAVEQSGDLWFLAGTLDGAPVNRSCQVPRDKNFLVPVFVISSDGNGDEDLSVEEKRQLLSDVLSDSVPGPLNSKLCIVEGKVDGFAVALQRVQSPPFRFGTDDEAVADGYWFALQLQPGEHLIDFTGILCNFDTEAPIAVVDVTYTLTVE